MPLFRYKIIDTTGKTIEGTMDAKDRFELYHQIKKDGGTVILAEEVKPKSFLSSINNLPFLNTVSFHDKITFANNLAKMIDAGLPITRALSIMERESKGELKRILGELSQSLTKGKTLSESMKPYPKTFSKLFVSMVRSGEESGNLSQSLKNVGLQMEKSYQLTRKIRGALMYPAIIVLLMIAIGTLMMIYMVPTLTATFTGLGIELPFATRVIIATSNILVNHFVILFAGVLGLVTLFVTMLQTEKGKRVVDYVLLRLPVVGLMVKEINAARTARTLSSLLSSGVDIIVATEVTREVLQNSYYKEVLDEIQVAIQKGASVSSIFSQHSKLYPIFVSEMTSVGEETGKIGEMLMNVALFYEDEIDQKTKDMSSVIEPLLMVFIGVSVGIFAIAIISPIYSIGDSIK